MTKLNLEYCQNRHHEIQVELDQMDELKERENRAFTEDEVTKYRSLIDEDARLNNFMEGQLTGKKLEEHRERKAKSQMLRELFKKCREEKVAYSEEMHDREAANATTILLNPAAGNTKGNIEASGAIPLVIHELIDTKVTGLELPDDLRLLTGVIGNEIWPYSIDDIEYTVAGEVEPIGEQAINFAKLSASPERVAASVAVSNRAIDNAAFDLLGFVTYKFQKGLAKFYALHVYSHCEFTNALKSPFASVDVEEIELDENIGKNIAKKIAAIWDLGFEGEPELIMDKTIETELMFTKAIPGQCGDRTVIQDGRCVGYRYKVSPYINYALDGSTPKTDGNHYIGIGHWGYLAFEQHGSVRFTVDSQSAEVAKRNSTVLVLNTEYSLTELSQKVNGANGIQAFKLLKVVDSDSSSDL